MQENKGKLAFDQLGRLVSKVKENIDLDFSGRILIVGIFLVIAGIIAATRGISSGMVISCFLEGLLISGIGAIPFFVEKNKTKLFQSIACFAVSIIFIILLFAGFSKNGTLIGIILTPYLIFKGFQRLKQYKNE